MTESKVVIEEMLAAGEELEVLQHVAYEKYGMYSVRKLYSGTEKNRYTIHMNEESFMKIAEDFDSLFVYDDGSGDKITIRLTVEQEGNQFFLWTTKDIARGIEENFNGEIIRTFKAKEGEKSA